MRRRRRKSDEEKEDGQEEEETRYKNRKRMEKKGLQMTFILDLPSVVSKH